MKRTYFKLVSCLIILILCSGSVSAVSTGGINENFNNVLDNNLSEDVVSDDYDKSVIDFNDSVGSVKDSGVDVSDDYDKSVIDFNDSVGSVKDSGVDVSDDSVGSVKDSNADNKVKSLEDGDVNITFDNGYSGYCVDHELNYAREGYTFTVHNCSMILNNVFNKSIGDYLKILFFNYWDELNQEGNSFFTDWEEINEQELPLAINYLVWCLSDFVLEWDGESPESLGAIAPILGDVINDYNNGVRINDHGEVKKINETDELIFDFIALISDSNETQSYFAYKVTHVTKNSTDDNGTDVPVDPDNHDNGTDVPVVPVGNNTDDNGTGSNNTDDSNNGGNGTDIVNYADGTINKYIHKDSNLSDGISMQHTGNPVLVLLMLLFVLPSLVYRRK